MPANEKEILQVVREFFDSVNKGAMDANDPAWKHLADPDNFEFTEAFGACLGKAEAIKSMNSWLKDRGMRMDLKDMKATLNWIPGVHMVEANVTYRFPSEPLQGLGTSQQGAFFVTLDDQAKILRIHNIWTGPEAENLRHQFFVSALKMHEGKKLEGSDEAIKALEKVLASLAYRDPKKFIEDLTDDAVLIDPINITRGKEAISKTMNEWFSSGMNGGKPIADVISLLPHSSTAKVEYDFSKMPEGCPVSKTTRGNVQVRIDPGSKKITRVVALPYEEQNLKWNPDLINWMRKNAATQAAA